MTDREEPHVSLLRATLNPEALGEVGTTPDYRFSLANERTFLAWLRTALALAGGGLAVAQFLPPFHVTLLRELVAAALMLLGAACALRAVVHWVACERAMRRGRDLPTSRFPTVLAALVFVGAVTLLVVTAAGLLAP